MTMPAILSIPGDAIPDLKKRMDKRIVRAETGCLEWVGAKSPDGYGITRVRIDGKTRVISAHRASWMANKGPIPADHVLDHLCRVRNCVNVDHLDAITANHNTWRGHASREGVRNMPRPRGVEPELWQAALRAAKGRDENLSDIVRAALREYVNTNQTND